MVAKLRAGIGVSHSVSAVPLSQSNSVCGAARLLSNVHLPKKKKKKNRVAFSPVSALTPILVA